MRQTQTALWSKQLLIDPDCQQHMADVFRNGMFAAKAIGLMRTDGHCQID